MEKTGKQEEALIHKAPVSSGNGESRELGPGKSIFAAAFLWGFATLAVAGLGCAATNENMARSALEAHGRAFSISRSGSGTDNGDSEAVPNGTLESYISYAMQNSAELEALFERWQAGVNWIAQTRRLPDPVISYSYYIRNVETRVGPQRHRLSLKQSFPWPTRLSAGADAASARARALQRRFDARAIAIGAAVEEKYWSLWRVQTVRKIHEDHVVILKGLSESASALLMTGRIELADQQQIDLTSARIEDLLFSLDDQTEELKAELKGVIGAPQSMPVLVVSSPSTENFSVDEDQLLVSVRNHPYIHSFEDLAEASEATAKQEAASRYPSFSLGVDWIETGESSSPNVPDSGKDAVLVGIGISVPLWQHNNKESVEAQNSETRAYRADARAATDRAIAEYFAVVANIRDAKRRIVLYENTLVPQAQSVFESVIGSYVSGRGSIASILLAQRDLLELRVQYVDILSDYAKGWASLENLVGHEIKPGETSPKQDREAQ